MNVNTAPRCGEHNRADAPDRSQPAAGIARDILLVDDEVETIALLAEILTIQGHTVRLAANGKAALAAVEEREPDLVLLDLQLPDMSGYEIAQRLRARTSSHSLRLVALSGSRPPADAASMAEQPFDARLVKPMDMVVLQDLLQGL